MDFKRTDPQVEALLDELAGKAASMWARNDATMASLFDRAVNMIADLQADRAALNRLVDSKKYS